VNQKKKETGGKHKREKIIGYLSRNKYNRWAEYLPEKNDRRNFL
jgi:hypothetical protein